MAFFTHVGRFTKITDTGSQTITGVGFTPVVVIFFSALHTGGDASFQNESAWSIGFDTGNGTTLKATHQRVYAGSSPSAVSYGNTHTRSVIDRVGFLAGRITSMSSDGFVFNWDLGSLGGEYDGCEVHFLALGGSIQAAIVDANSASVTGTHSVNGVGFEPDALLAIGDSPSSSGSIGFAASSSLQCASTFVSNDSQNPTKAKSYQRTNKFLISLSVSDASVLLDEGALTSIDSDGFTYNSTAAAGAGFSILCLKGVEVSCGTLTQPTTAGSQSVSSLGFAPKCVLFAGFCHTATTSIVAHAKGLFGASDGIGQAGIWCGDVDNIATPQTPGKYQHYSKAINMATAPSTVNAQASVASLDTTGGFTLNWSTVDATARGVMWIALGVPLATTPPAPGDTDPCGIVTPHYFSALRPTNTSTVHLAAKTALRDTSTYYGGYKAPRLLTAGLVTRAASDYKTGAWSAQSADATWADADFLIRNQFGTVRSDWISSEFWLYLVSEAQRQSAGTPRLLFYGKVQNEPSLMDLTYQFSANDVIGAEYRLLGDEKLIPQRITRLDEFPACSVVNRGLGVPIIGGEVSNGTNGAVKLIDVGDFVCADSVTRRCLLVAGHACKEVLALYQNNTLISSYGTDAWAPGQTGWTSIQPSGQSYFDINGQRFTLVFVSGDRATDIDDGKYVYADVQGMETAGDGSGSLITGLLQLYKHLMVNWFVGNYRAGAWLASPTFEFFPGGTTLAVIDESSWDDAATLAGTYLGGGYLGAFVIGANGRRLGVRQQVANANVSCNVSLGLSKNNQLFVKMLDLDRGNFINSRPILTDRKNILSSPRFDIAKNRDWFCNQLLASYSANYRDDGLGEWSASTEQGHAPSHIQYGGEVLYEDFYGLTRDQSTAETIAQQRLFFMAEVPRMVTWAETLCGLKQDILDGVPLTHYGGIGTTGYVDRALWIVKQVIDPSVSKVITTAVDVENLLT